MLPDSESLDTSMRAQLPERAARACSSAYLSDSSDFDVSVDSDSYSGETAGYVVGKKCLSI